MPDITMCSNDTCPNKLECYRFTAKPSEFRQSYAEFTPNEDGNCDNFINNSEWNCTQQSQ